MKNYAITGLLGPAVIYIGIFLAIFLNSDWWSLENNAISDMGHIGLKYWYVLDIPLIIGGVLLSHSTWFVKDDMHTNLERYAMWAFFFSAILLTLIGVFPEGTNIQGIHLHWIVSISFFLLATASLFVEGLGLLLEGNRIGIWILLIISLQYIFSTWAFFTFEGFAISEFISSAAIIASYYIILFFVLK